ncbi:hypothetical protein ADENT20671_1184 [Actinomyces denticolens]|nr:hypothetical protein ADENT20671_1184 [Actinomyces denticolens]
MGGDGHAPGGTHEGAGLDGVERPVERVVGAGDGQGAGEGGVPVLEGARSDERVGDMGPADGVAGRLGEHVLPRDGVIDGDALDHAPGAGSPGVAGMGEGLGEGRAPGVEEVGEQVKGDAARGAGDLGAAQEGHARGRHGGRGLVPADRRVVVGQADDVEARLDGRPHELRRGVRAVGARGVGVGVDAHRPSLGGRAGPLLPRPRALTAPRPRAPETVSARSCALILAV